jgi:DNA-binding transcriptional LysR family regulator
MSPTALSGRIRSLEDRLVTCLFNRTTRRVSLTSAGQEFIAHIAPSLTEIDRATETVGSHGTQPSSALRLNTSVTAAHEVLLPVIHTFLDHHPLVQIELTTEAGWSISCLMDATPELGSADPCSPTWCWCCCSSASISAWLARRTASLPCGANRWRRAFAALLHPVEDARRQRVPTGVRTAWRVTCHRRAERVVPQRAIVLTQGRDRRDWAALYFASRRERCAVQVARRDHILTTIR